MTVEILVDDPHDQELLRNARPSDWVNPKPAERYQLLVVGAGTAGLVSAAAAAGLGARVALVERELMGGDCLNVGCVPSKALIRAARTAAEVRDAGPFGIRVDANVSVDFAAVMERLRKLRAQISPADSVHRFQKLGVDVFFGQGKFVASDRLEVNGIPLRFAKAVIATGARASRPSIAGLDDYLTNESVFALRQLPKRLAVLGAGPIGCELAQAFSRLGANVILIGNHPQVLPKEDPQAAERVIQSLRRDGVDLRLGCELASVKRQGSEQIVSLRSHGGEVRLASVDTILVGAGRTPNVEGMGLEAAQVIYDKRSGIVVDERLRTSNPRIFAAGDVCSAYKFTHAADAMARIVVQNALFRGRAKASTLVIPRCTYTDPEIAQVGMTEAEAKQHGQSLRTFFQPFEHVDRAILDGEEQGFVKLVAGPKGRILGATIVGRHAGEMISEITLAMTAGLTLPALAKTIHPYPTQAEAIKKIADAYNRTRLTPLVQSLLKKWLDWTV